MVLILSWRKREKFTCVFVVATKPPEALSFILYKPLFIFFLFFQCTEKWTLSQKDIVIEAYLGTNPICLWWELDNIELHVPGVTGWCLRHCCLASRYLSSSNCQRLVSSELLGEIFKQNIYHCRGEESRFRSHALHQFQPNVWNMILSLIKCGHKLSQSSNLRTFKMMENSEQKLYWRSRTKLISGVFHCLQTGYFKSIHCDTYYGSARKKQIKYAVLYHVVCIHFHMKLQTCQCWLVDFIIYHDFDILKWGKGRRRWDETVLRNPI
jgi:hypothetical protein